jgi:thiamine-phosphate pyrophosphorylase
VNAHEETSTFKAQLSVLNTIVDVDVAQRAGWRPLDLARAFLAGGATFLQLRAKSLPAGEFLDLASAVVDAAHAAHALLIVNDRADIARLAGADGVHVGQDDLSPRAVRAVVDSEHAESSVSIVGLSTHSEAQLDAASREPITYVATGPVFGTTTKATGGPPVGLDMVRRAARLRLPVVAIGGITLDNARSVIDAGATSVAVISDLLVQGDRPEARVRAYLERLSRV